MTDRQRLALIALIELGERALQEIQRSWTDDEPESTSSLVFEDALRELAPEKGYLANYIHEQRGYSGEPLHIRHALEYLRALPLETAVAREEARVLPMLSRGWNKTWGRADEERYPFLKYPQNHIRARLMQLATYPPGSRSLKGLRGLARAEVVRDLSEQGFRTYRAGLPPPLKRLIKRVADVLVEEGLPS